MDPAPGALRPATAADAAACARIYAPYVTDTAISFETEVPSVAAMTARILEASHRHAWLVLQTDGDVTGYAYATSFNPRAAYRWACTVSVYVDAERRGRGAGRALYAALLERLRQRGYYQALAGITQPNDASNALHRAMGFEEVARYRRVGWKLGRWHDVLWVQRELRTSSEAAGSEAAGAGSDAAGSDPARFDAAGFDAIGSDAARSGGPDLGPADIV